MPTTLTRTRSTAEYPADPLTIRAGELGRRFRDWADAIEAARPHNEHMIALHERRDELKKLAERPAFDADPVAVGIAAATVQVLTAQIARLTPPTDTAIEGQYDARSRYVEAAVRYQRRLRDLRERATELTDKQLDETRAELDRLAGLAD